MRPLDEINAQIAANRAIPLSIIVFYPGCSLMWQIDLEALKLETDSWKQEKRATTSLVNRLPRFE